MARAEGENFPVASHALPRRIRRHFLALYGFARLVDEVGDEIPGDRLAALDWLEAEVDRVYSGEATHPLMQRLTPTVAGCRIPPEPFRRLIEANRRDQVVHAYKSFQELESYCALSANPVGHLVLHVLGAATPDRMRLSDRICTGLQLTEHWQDVREDLGRGRVYVPEEDLARFACSRADLERASASERVRQLMAFEVERTRELLAAGTPLVRRLSLRPALAVAAFVAGGRAALKSIERADYDVLAGPPRASRAERVGSLVATLADGFRRVA
jgi:squalene synthase HpnC